MALKNPFVIDNNEELIKKGLERSCESLGFFLKEKVELESLTFSDALITETPLRDEFRSKDIILFSEIIGQIGGQCFFLLDLKEADILYRKNFPAGGNSASQNTIFEAFLLELDNIIAASVVTEFSNHLQVKIFGGVPAIFYQAEEEKINELINNTGQNLYTINFKCRYKIQSIEFSPVFFWFFESKFLDVMISTQRR